MPEKFTKKDQIVSFLRRHPSWYLEVCHGSGLYWWWAVRKSTWPGGTIYCNGNAAAHAAHVLVKHTRRAVHHGVRSSIEDVRWSAHKKMSWKKPVKPVRKRS